MYKSLYNVRVTQYSVSEARGRLPDLIEEAQAGEAVQLTRHGKTVAVLVSAREFERMKKGGKTFAEAYAEYRQKFPEGELDLPADYWESIRDRSPGREVDLS